MNINNNDNLIETYTKALHNIPENISDEQLFINTNFIKISHIANMARMFYEKEKDKLSIETIEKLKKIITL